jgi:RNase adapter protein RapZ
MKEGSERRRVVVVTGLSGAGKLSVLGALEDLGFDTVDNPPLELLSEMVGRSGGKVAIGVDARTRGFDAGEVVATLAALGGNPALRPELVYVTADETTLLRRYTESRRPHPLAPNARVTDGIAQEQALTGPLREAADLVLDTSDLPLAAMRRLIGLHFGADATDGQLVVTLTSFAYRQGLPREADLVFDSRFLRNPHYEPTLRPRTGLDPKVGAFIEADPDFPSFFERVAGLVEMLLPRFVQEGKKYATIAIGCTGGRHRSVYLVEKLAARLAGRQSAQRGAGGSHPWRLHVMHRELARAETITAQPTSRPASGHGGDAITDDRLSAALAVSGTGGLNTI